MTKRRLLPPAALALATAACVAVPGAAVAATPAANAEPSSNWAGYAASGAQFSKVSGS